MDEDTWCIKVTEENKKVVGDWVKTVEKGWAINIDTYYGLKNGRSYYGSFDKPLDKLLSTSEFLRKINKVSNYEIYY